MGDSYLTLREAAWLMGISEQEAIDMCAKGELLYVKSSVRGYINGSTMIHQSEMTRFSHPWRQIFRLEERMNAQQTLVELLKSKINERGVEHNASDIRRLQDELETLQDRQREMDKFFSEIKDEWPNIREICAAMKEKLDAPAPARRKRSPNGRISPGKGVAKNAK